MEFKELSVKGEVAAVLRTFGKKGFATQRVEKAGLTLAGIPGDRHSGFHKLAGAREKKLYKKGAPITNLRQWSAVSVEELELIAKAMDVTTIRPEHLGANFLFKGIPELTSLPPLTRIRIGKAPYQATIVVYEENLPCKHPQEEMEKAGVVIKGKPFTKAAAGKRGLVGWVEHGGRVKTGDPVQVFVPKFSGFSDWLD